MNKIDWTKYVDYIFCMNYMPDNRIEEISNTLQNIGINIYDNRFFSFIYDNEHKLFLDEINLIRNKSYSFYDNHVLFKGNKMLNKNNLDYVIYVSLTTYKILKIAQYFNYERIIIFEDDIKFLKDIDYIDNAMQFIKDQNDFDICICQTTFVNGYHGIKSYLISEVGCEDLGNDMFLRIDNTASGVFGGAFIILTKQGIKNILNIYESNNFLTCLDSFDSIRHIFNLKTIFALKPLCVQKRMLTWTKEQLYMNNANINIEEYIN